MTRREIVQANKTPNPRYHHQTGFIIGEALVGVESGTNYVIVKWIDESISGDKRQVMDRRHLTTIGFADPDGIIPEEPDLYGP